MAEQPIRVSVQLAGADIAAGRLIPFEEIKREFDLL